MGVVDLHHVELLHDLRVDLVFAGFELWDDGLAKIYRQKVVQNIK